MVAAQDLGHIVGHQGRNANIVPALAVFGQEDLAAFELETRDFRFGRGQEGDYAMLKAAGDTYGYGVSHMGTLTFEHGRVSSSRIRDALAEGDFPLAEKLLGRRYFIMGRVVYGRQLGRLLGVPTANIIRGATGRP